MALQLIPDPERLESIPPKVFNSRDLFDINGRTIQMREMARERTLLCLTVSSMDDFSTDGTLLWLLATKQRGFERVIYERDITTVLITRTVARESAEEVGSSYPVLFRNANLTMTPLLSTSSWPTGPAIYT